MDNSINKRKVKNIELLRRSKIEPKDLAFLGEQEYSNDQLEKTNELLRENIDTTKTLIEEVKKKYDPEVHIEIDRRELKGEKGDKGENYTLSEEDKKAISSSIIVPIVEKVVEKTIEKIEVIREQPIVNTEIKEIAIYETPDQILEKVNVSRGYIKKDKIEGLIDLERIAKNNQTLPVTTSFFNGLRGKNLYIVGATASQSGDTVTLIISGGGGSQTPWLSDIDAASFQLLNANNILLNSGAAFQQKLASSIINLLYIAMNGRITLGDASNYIDLYGGINGVNIKGAGLFTSETTNFLLDMIGNLILSGTITANNFSGTSSGTNTGDQDLSPYALIASFATVAFTGNYSDLIGAPAGLGYQTPSGIVNGMNTIFSFSLGAPTVVVVDGITLNQSQSDGTVNWTGSNPITLKIAPTSNIFSIV